MVRRTKENAEATRSQLLDAAETVFNEKGVSRTSLAEIATAAGVTRGAIYWHFKNKADLFHAMMERVKLPIDEMIDKLNAEQLTDPLAFLRNVAVSVLVRVATDAQTRRVFDILNHKCELVDEMAIGRERQLERRNECVSCIEESIRAAIDQKLLPRTINPHSAAIGWHALISGLISFWVLHPESFSLADEAPSMIETYLTGLREHK